MFIIITNETLIPDEAFHLNQLFDEGLEVLHFRKPGITKNDYKQLLQQIDTSYHPKIMLHQYHDLVEKFNVRGVHLKEQLRIHLKGELNNYIKNYKKEGFVTSGSFHSTEDIEKSNASFDYMFLSPVFNSISKKGYKGKAFNVSHLNKNIIGMGGIDENNMQWAHTLGFKGVGILGRIWNSENSVQNYKTILKAYNTVYK